MIQSPIWSNCGQKFNVSKLSSRTPFTPNQLISQLAQKFRAQVISVQSLSTRVGKNRVRVVTLYLTRYLSSFFLFGSARTVQV